ncbi:nitrous oxide-stimulated promoter family protein [Sporolactobacillus laevolacticus]|uniref:nitrous oxide-stimulated promoter family protein n=1 Tax=Sporolactobacillus laevolacticus TaxID=33018 RepID=UPI0025B549A9|nr:nitrous oxide-stimulated promoter family protein [Sporolactobacillus laevolacticus]MDN3955197.1 nitrous oxide-stimulated promoter family protein [Sporolactobacillus laevolacticus]
MSRALNNGPVIQQEKDTVKKMIAIYCRKKHHHQELCDECRDLQLYALKRLSHCPFGEKKTACSNCEVHCYSPIYRKKIKAVMRCAGIWMLLYHPFFSVKHLLKK